MESKYHYAVYDLETGGFSKEKNGICEIAIIMLNSSLEVVGEYEKIIAPYGDFEYSAGAFEANGMNMEMIKTQGSEAKQTFKEVYEFLNSFSEGKGAGKQKPILCGQNNIKFDNPYLEHHMSYFKKDLWKVAEKNFTIDTMWMGRLRHKESVNYKLATLCSNEGIVLEDAHRAMADTKVTAELVKIYINALRGVGVKEEEEIQTNLKENKRFRESFEI